MEQKGERRPLSRTEEVVKLSINPDMAALEGLSGIARPRPPLIKPMKIECADGVTRELVLSNPPEEGWELIE